MASGESATMISYNWMLPSLNDPKGQSGDLAGKFRAATRSRAGKPSWGLGTGRFPKLR